MVNLADAVLPITKKCEIIPIRSEGVKDKFINKSDLKNSNIQRIIKCQDIYSTIYTGLSGIIPYGSDFCSYSVYGFSIQNRDANNDIKGKKFKYFDDEISLKQGGSCPGFDAKREVDPIFWTVL